jgi:hypothetical protein
MSGASTQACPNLLMTRLLHTRTTTRCSARIPMGPAMTKRTDHVERVTCWLDGAAKDKRLADPVVRAVVWRWRGTSSNPDHGDGGRARSVFAFHRRAQERGHRKRAVQRQHWLRLAPAGSGWLRLAPAGSGGSGRPLSPSICNAFPDQRKRSRGVPAIRRDV